jgi:hypothetical protein
MRRVSTCVLLMCLAVTANTAWADDEEQPNCGSITVRNDIYQERNLLYVGVDGNTMREMSICPKDVQTEIWVDGVSRDVGVNRGSTSSPVYIGRPVPSYGNYNSKGKHWVIHNPGTTFQLWELYDQSTDVTLVAHADEEEPQTETCGMDYEWNPATGQCELKPSPILADLSRDGFKLTSAGDGVMFDIDADGMAEQVAWTERDSDDSWLAMDRNGNGRIDNGAELFGNASPAYADEPRGPRAMNRFPRRRCRQF